MKDLIVLVDSCQEYAKKFSEYVNSRTYLPFEVIFYTDYEEAKIQGFDAEIALIIVEQNFMDDFLREFSSLCEKVICLVEEEVTKDRCVVCRYQSMERIIEIVGSYHSQAKTVQITQFLKTTATYRMIYSPINRCCKTTLALLMAKVLAKKESVLLVSLDSVGILHQLLRGKARESPKGRGSLSDAYYFYEHGDGEQAFVQEVCKNGNIDYLANTYVPEDIKQMNTQKLCQMIDDLCEEKAYQHVIIDVGNEIGELEVLLNKADTIYMPSLKDMISQEKLISYQNYLIAKKENKILARLKTVPMDAIFSAQSSFKDVQTFHNYADTILWGELGDYVRSTMV